MPVQTGSAILDRADRCELEFRCDLDFVSRLVRLGHDEFWCGEHHSSGWEMIANPRTRSPSAVHLQFDHLTGRRDLA